MYAAFSSASCSRLLKSSGSAVPMYAALSLASSASILNSSGSAFCRLPSSAFLSSVAPFPGYLIICIILHREALSRSLRTVTPRLERKRSRRPHTGGARPRPLFLAWAPLSHPNHHDIFGIGIREPPHGAYRSHEACAAHGSPAGHTGAAEHHHQWIFAKSRNGS